MKNTKQQKTRSLPGFFNTSSELQTRMKKLTAISTNALDEQVQKNLILFKIFFRKTQISI